MVRSTREEVEVYQQRGSQPYKGIVIAAQGLKEIEVERSLPEFLKRIEAFAERHFPDFPKEKIIAYWCEIPVPPMGTPVTHLCLHAEGFVQD